ncbi:MAG: SCO family protein, partial [Verrucomicrobiota bacterium]|nr:SCO family protein [Verrucomicrobiota bacterium]
YIPNFALLDQNGRFSQIRQLRGKPYVLNFIFTRCMVPEMCPAATTKMSQLQALAARNGWKDLNFVSITMDPTFDSPGILNQYMQANGLESNNFHFLTHFDSSVVEDILLQFGILTRDENNTITHTMTTFLIDSNGKIVYAIDGPRWSVNSMMKAAERLFN